MTRQLAGFSFLHDPIGHCRDTVFMPMCDHP